MTLTRAWQLGLLALALIGAVVLAGAIGLMLTAGNRNGPPARAYHLSAGPYALELNLYRDPPQAGLPLAFSIAPGGASETNLSYEVTSQPDYTLRATPIHASLAPDPGTPGGVVGSAELPVRGDWTLEISVDGPRGSGFASVPIQAVAPPPVPDWLGWAIGFVPAVGLLVFLFALATRRREEDAPPL